MTKFLVRLMVSCESVVGRWMFGAPWQWLCKWCWLLIQSPIYCSRNKCTAYVDVQH